MEKIINYAMVMDTDFNNKYWVLGEFDNMYWFYDTTNNKKQAEKLASLLNAEVFMNEI